MKHSSTRKRGSCGFTLIEVLIGILIFAIGMMALARLQGNLARNSGDSNARTVATNIAEEVIERARVFQQIDSDGTNAAYNDIVDATETIQRGGNYYTVVTDVTDFYYDPDEDEFTTTVPTGAGRSDFKQIDLTVTWNSGQEFQIDNENSTTGRLGSGSIRITDVVSSIPSGAGGKATVGVSGTGSYAPPVDYNPGENPDIVSIELGDNKFKESTTPLPDVIRADELVETTFDVVTYSQNNNGATFLRREEFRAVSCECTLQVPETDAEGGLRPTVWDGDGYTEGEFVSKAYGEATNNNQSQFCGICCRDHHDGGTSDLDNPDDPGRGKYFPFRYSGNYFDGDAGGLAGDHKHYSRSQQGNLVLADSDGDNYVEACRLVRKDGFWRVAQDLRQEGLNAFPGHYLDDDSEVGVYSDYVTDAVGEFVDATNPYNVDNPTNAYEFSNLTMTAPAEMDPPLIFPASTYGTATEFPSETGETEQQLRTRGIYIDYLSDVLRARIECLDPADGRTGEDCGVPDVSSALEIIPFYDVQLTWLARWNETPNNNPIDVTNEAIADDNSHDRGRATLESGFGYSTINSAVHRGNLGLTGTDPIDPFFSYGLKSYNLYALAIDYSTPPTPGFVFYGEIVSAVGGVFAANVEIVSKDDQAECDRTTTGFECVITEGATNPLLKVYNYYKNNTSLVACSGSLEISGQHAHIQDNGVGNWTWFKLPTEPTTNATIVIKKDSCG